jgi:hypothetical protein
MNPTPMFHPLFTVVYGAADDRPHEAIPTVSPRFPWLVSVNDGRGYGALSGWVAAARTGQ